MKREAFLAATILSAALFTGQLYAQVSHGQNDLAVNQPLKASGPADGSSVAPTPDAATSTINLRAIKDFKLRFTKSSDEHWSRIDKGFGVYLINDGYKIRAFYDLKGHWRASLKYCDESQLPDFIRDVVRRTYYDLAITGVIIAEVPEHVAYFVNVEDKGTFKALRVSEDAEIEVLRDCVKLH